MPKADYVARPDDAFLAQLKTFASGLTAYAATFGILPAQITALNADIAHLEYVLQAQYILRNTTQQFTAWKNFLRDGGTMPSAGAPLPPAMPDAVPAVDPGIEPRFRDLASQIKRHAAYNPSIGEGLGIEGAQQSAQDPAAIQPKLKLTSSGGQVTVLWSWNGTRGQVDMLEIEVDRDGTGWKTLAFDTTPNYVDTTPFPAAPAKWKYRAIFRKSDQRIGQWSSEVSTQVSA